MQALSRPQQALFMQRVHGFSGRCAHLIAGGLCPPEMIRILPMAQKTGDDARPREPSILRGRTAISADRSLKILEGNTVKLCKLQIEGLTAQANSDL